MRTLPDKITPLELSNGTVMMDGGNFIVDPNDWSEEFALHMAKEEGVELTPLHWEVINYMRERLAEDGIMVDVRFVSKFLAKREGIPKKEAHNLLYKLFPYGYVKQACRISGMKQPRAWSTG